MSLSSLTIDLTLGLAKFEADSGKAAQIVSRDAEKMARATDKADAAIRRYTASFTENNRSLNFVTAAQLEQIKAFQESGRASGAQIAVLDLLIGRFEKLEPNLRGVDHLVRDVTATWNGFWDAVYGVGRVAMKISSASRRNN